ncbi:glycosyltransferase [Halomonas alkalisoli]|uniref:glycosyltransferase n=1 Tax=Halomonas alkalisoli TaxID=2907158 RepID=UPI001F42E448|nr:glycosyltransferase [Halomonas alkalisoli]MCE9681667.1 glycosyltransferase [Halomonas alkalisoli]
MKRSVVLISYSFNRGGAGIAASKFKQLLASNFSNYEILSISQDDAGMLHFFKRLVAYAISKFQFDGNPIKHSLNLFTYQPVLKSFKASSSCIHHLHWINNDTLSVLDFDKIPVGSIVTLHDEWMYCGAEHCYKITDKEYDFVKGYSFFKKGVFGIHWNYFIWILKRNKLCFRDDIIFTVPSKWMLERARSSFILKHADVRYLPNPIDTDVFVPRSTASEVALRHACSINSTDFVICFGAVGGKRSYLKGSHLLDEALMRLSTRLTSELKRDVKLIDFGGLVEEGFLHGFRSVSLGPIFDPNKLSLLYSSVDLVIVPSLVESFGQIAAESLSCGTPVVCFNTSGLIDIVHHKETGMVAEAFDANSLAEQIEAMIELPSQARKAMGQAGREHVIAHFSYSAVWGRYLKIIQDAEKLKNKRPEK